MNPPATPCSLHDDVWITTPRGRIFCRFWPAPLDAGTPGHNTPIVLFHDSLGCVDLWKNFPAQLSAATGRTVIAYDRLGFGRSDLRHDRLHGDFVADEAATFFPLVREQLGLRNFVAFGHSVGGGMAVHCAARDAAACAALVTVSAQAFVGDETRSGVLAAKAQFDDASLFGRLATHHGAKARWVLDAWTDTWLDPAFAAWSLAGALPMVTSPALVVHGVRDEYGSSRHPATIGDLCAGPARVVMLPDTGHVPHRECPGVLVALVADFLAAVR